MHDNCTWNSQTPTFWCSFIRFSCHHWDDLCSYIQIKWNKKKKTSPLQAHSRCCRREEALKALFFSTLQRCVGCWAAKREGSDKEEELSWVVRQHRDLVQNGDWGQAGWRNRLCQFSRTSSLLDGARKSSTETFSITLHPPPASTFLISHQIHACVRPFPTNTWQINKKPWPTFQSTF